MPVKRRPPKNPKKPKTKAPTKKWQEMATKRGYKTTCELADELFTQVLSVWSDNDPQKATLYLWGVLQGMAIQVGRLESLLAHSGYAHSQMLRHMCIERMGEAYETMCNLMNHTKSGEESVPSTLEELVSAITSSSLTPRKKPVPIMPNTQNVIPLPVFTKEER